MVIHARDRQLTALTGTGAAAPSFTVSSTTTAQMIQAGGSAVYSITVAAQNGSFNNAVNLSASGLPTGATATFVPASITPGSASASSQLTIQTAASTTTAGVSGRGSGWLLGASALPLLGLMFATRKVRKRWATLCIQRLGSLGAITAITGQGVDFLHP